MVRVIHLIFLFMLPITGGILIIFASIFSLLNFSVEMIEGPFQFTEKCHISGHLARHSRAINKIPT